MSYEERSIGETIKMIGRNEIYLPAILSVAKMNVG